MKVTRSERLDTAEWTPGPEGTAPTPEPPRKHRRLPVASFALVGVVMLVVGVVVLGLRDAPPVKLTATIADLQAVHANVSVAGEQVRRERRLANDDVVQTDAEGRARLRLDDGTAIVMDRATKLKLTSDGVLLEEGRLFVTGAMNARTLVGLGGASSLIGSATAAIERNGDAAKVYAPASELTVRAGAEETTVHGGETAVITGGSVKVANERAFDDWTGGMAVPWGPEGEPRRAIGELWGKSDANPGDAGSPLTIRSHEVRATIAGEIATTEARTVYFNGGSEAVRGDFRMAIPRGAIVRRFASGAGEALEEGHVALAHREQTSQSSSIGLLEWAGDGWLRGSVPSIAPGETRTVVVSYVEWLPLTPRPGGKTAVVQYRYPMASGDTPPLIGEFYAAVDASESRPVAVASGLGGVAKGQVVELRRSDMRPTADLVVDVEISAPTAPARAYVAPSADPTDPAKALVIRTELPEASREGGVTLALLLDTSLSVDPALLATEVAFVRAVLGALGPRDRLIVLAADQIVRPVGPATLGPLDEARRAAIDAALDALAPGGATDLGRSLEHAAGLLPADAPDAMLVYVGDGWPTLGDQTPDAILGRLARRPEGAPRLGAVAAGPLVNRTGLASLVGGSGPLLEIADSAEAAHVAVSLVAEALQPTVTSVTMELGPTVERVMPRGPHAVVAGGTFTAVGRLRGEPPTEITLRWRDRTGAHEERRKVEVGYSPDASDVARRWAAARVAEIALDGRGREAATDVALRAGLLTPWTAWVLGSPQTYLPTPMAARMLDIGVDADGGFAAPFATLRGGGAVLATSQLEGDLSSGWASASSMSEALASASVTVIESASPAVRACRDARAALRPELGGVLDIALVVDGEGRASDVTVSGREMDDAALDACVRVVISGLAFPAMGLSLRVDVRHAFTLPAPKPTLRGRTCSATSKLAMPLRRGIWKDRLDRAGSGLADVYLEAKRACELGTWTDRRALLELILQQEPSGLSRLDNASALEVAGEDDAAALIRREAVRRASDPDELRALRRRLIGEERLPYEDFKKAYAAATTNPARLGVLRRFLALAPHDARLLRLELALLGAKDGDPAALGDLIRRVRQDPFSDTGLLADAASMLHAAGDDDEARRAFGELAERAPSDPWARAFLGDRLRSEGWNDEATAAYAVLSDLAPGEPAMTMRLAMAHAAAGRLDLATRQLAEVARTGGRRADADLARLAVHLSAALTAEALSAPSLPAADKERLDNIAMSLPSPGARVVILLRAAAAAKLEAKLLRGPAAAREEREPALAARALGLWAFEIDPADVDVTVSFSGPEQLAPMAPLEVEVLALVPGAGGAPASLVSAKAAAPISGKPIELSWSGKGWSAGKAR